MEVIVIAQKRVANTYSKSKFCNSVRCHRNYTLHPWHENVNIWNISFNGRKSYSAASYKHTCNSLSWFAEFTSIISEGEVVVTGSRESEREIEAMAAGRLVFIHSTDRLNNLSSATRRQKHVKSTARLSV